MPILYSLVSRGSVVLAEFAATTGNFTMVARKILEKLPPNPLDKQKMSYVFDKHLFHYLIDGDLVFLCMTDEEFGRSIPFAFLEDIKNRFRASYGNRGTSAPPMGMNSDFSRVLQNQMEYYSSGKSDKMKQVKGQIEEVKTTMVDNIENVLKRGERIELLVDRTENLENSAMSFRQKAVTLKRTLWWKNVKLWAVLICIGIFAVYFFVSIGCGGLSLPRCRRSHHSDNSNSGSTGSSSGSSSSSSGPAGSGSGTLDESANDTFPQAEENGTQQPQKLLKDKLRIRDALFSKLSDWKTRAKSNDNAASAA